MGQPPLQGLLPLAQEGLLANDKRDQAAIAFFEFDRSHHRGLQPFASPECRFDLSQLHAKASYLDLVVRAAKKVEAPIREFDGKIAALKKSAGGERIGKEARLVKIGPIEITESHAGSADVHLAHRTLRHRLKLWIEKMNADIRQRVADGDLFCIDLDPGSGGANSRFARPILIP